MFFFRIVFIRHGSGILEVNPCPDLVMPTAGSKIPLSNIYTDDSDLIYGSASGSSVTDEVARVM